MCLSELKECDLSAIFKLKLEIELLQIKRILLDNKVEKRVQNVFCSEVEFTDLHDQFYKLRSFKSVEIEELISKLLVIKKGLLSQLEVKQNRSAC